MITIPTCDLVGILGDVTPFADPEEENFITHAVRLLWDGDELHAQATDRYLIGWSRWSADDAPADNKDALLPKWGGADDPWSIVLALADAQDIIKNFKLGAKQGNIPLNVDYIDGRLRILRAKLTGLSALTQDIDGAEATDYPDIEGLLASTGMPTPTDAIFFNPEKLARFAKVRPRGPMQMTFTGATRPCHIAIGKRFNGAIMPMRDGEDTAGARDE